VARPLQTIKHHSNDFTFQQIQKLIKEWEITLFVVGLPLHPDGEEHEMTQRCRRFANQLHGRFGIATVLVDERYSSAVLVQQQNQPVDDQAAAIILQQYFDDYDSTRT
jgi:putative Holliday junction resolvase